MRARMFKFVRDRCIERGKPGQPIKATSRFIDNVFDATKAIAKLEDCTEPPAWMLPVHAVAPPGDIIPMQNGLFDHRTRTLHPPSEHLFNYAALPFAYDASPPLPVEWMKFLRSILG